MFKTAMILTKHALTNRKGVTAAEYAVLAAGIVLVVAVAAGTLGTRIVAKFNTIVPT